MSTRPLVFLRILLLCGVLAWGAWGQAGEFGPDPLPIDRIDSAGTDPKDSLLGAVQAAQGEEALVALGRSIAADAQTSATASREHALLNIAIRLRAEGGEASLPLLDALAARRPVIMTHDVICREVVPLPLYPYHEAARAGAYQIRFRGERAAIADRLKRGDFTWIEAAADGELSEPAFAARLAELKSVPAVKMESARRSISPSREGGNARARQRLLAEICIATKTPPSESELRALEDDVAFDLVRRAGEFGDGKDAMLKVARSDGRFASLVELETSVAGVSLRDQLVAGGASAAQRIARDTAPGTTRELSAIAHDAKEDAALRRDAIMALILQGTSSSKDALKDLAGDETLPATLREKLAARIP
ncbi:hypothetical protein IT571_07355 [Candidatus Sumerlaeota bacterium]|nr:hypothetical protein [Candidatus Sumerlaeota bacterium]